MSKQNGMMKRIVNIAVLLMLGASLSACAGFLGFGGDSWKEEVLLHDGSKIIVERTAKRGGRHEIGQKPPFESQQMEFVMPATGERVTWVDEYSKDIGTASFLPMLLDIRQGVAYLVANNMGCLSYNKWGRPNPPYVVFKYENKEWKRIPLQELPPQISSPNLIQSEPDATAERIRKTPIPAETIQRIISNYRQPEYRTILREALAKGPDCGEMAGNGKGKWVGMGWFRDKPTYEACVSYCQREDFDAQHCPCSTIFKGAN
jgi:predicted small secreted protein